MRMLSRRLLARAHHEAGHAAVAFAFRRKVMPVSIVARRTTTSGRCMADDSTTSHQIRVNVGPQAQRLIEEKIVIDFAGVVAERLFLKKHLQGSWAPGPDSDKAKRLAQSFCYSPDETSAYMHWLYRRTVNLMTLPEQRAATEAVAGALIKKKELTGKEACKIAVAAIQKLAGCTCLLSPSPRGGLRYTMGLM